MAPPVQNLLLKMLDQGVLESVSGNNFLSQVLTMPKWDSLTPVYWAIQVLDAESHLGALGTPLGSWFVVLDLKNTHWHIPITPRSFI